MIRPIPLGHMYLPGFRRISLPLGFLLTVSLTGLQSGRAAPAPTQEKKEEARVEKALPATDLSRLVLRNLGPATMGGRVVDLAFHPTRRSTFYVATASGGLWKTVNAGTTFLPLFQHEATVSIGAIALAPSDPKQIWVGTGEANNRNSSSWGNGVYKSSDAGETWKHMGLPRSLHIGRIAVHPRDPRIVFVAALGSLWGQGPERGLYRTKDGGASWKKVLEGDAKTGATEVRLDPENPDIVYAALYERQRDAFDGNHPKKRWGEGSGLYRSTDGGETFEKLSKGLPTCKMGRISLDIYRKDPSVVYALIETEKIGTLPEGAPKPEPRAAPGAAVMGARFEDAIGGVKVLEVEEESAAKKAGLEAGDVIIELARDATADSGELRTVLASAPTGRGLPMKVIRGAKLEELEITLAAPAGRQTGGGRGRGGQRGGAYMGVQLDDAEKGALLAEVVQGGPAEAGGLESGDVVLSVDGKPTPDSDELSQVLRALDADQKVTLEILRDGKKRKVTMTMGSRARRFGRGGRSGVADRIGGQQPDRMRMQGPNGFQTGGIFRSEDRGKTWERINSLNPRPYYFSQIRVDPSDNRYLYVCGISFHMSEDGGKSFKRGNSAPGVHVDHHALWIDPDDGRHVVLGCDGGVNVSWDRCKSWEVFENLDIGQCYHATADTRRPYWVYAGYQDNGSWGGPSATRWREGILNSDWFKVGSGDGFVCRVDPEDPDIVFAESQGGRIRWTNVMTRQGGSVRSPRSTQLREARKRWPDMPGMRESVRTEKPMQDKPEPDEPTQEEKPGPDEPMPDAPLQEAVEQEAAVAEPREATARPARPRGRARRRLPRNRYRANWDTPFLLSHFNSKTIYFAGNYVCKSTDRGAHTQVISGKLSLVDDPTGGTATALSESPRRPGLIWVGTDDGALYVTKNDGATWASLHQGLSSMRGDDAEPIWVSSVHASRYKDGRAYVSLDGHRVDDRAPYVYVTEDYGSTWKSLAPGLEADASVHVIYEDSKNQDLLYLGTEMGLYISLDRGKDWQRLEKPFPTVAVRDFDIQEREQDLIIATHGRSIWTLDVGPLRALTAANRKKSVYLVKPQDVLRLRTRGLGKQGHRHFKVANPAERARFYYHLNEDAKDEVRIEVRDVLGKLVWSSKVKKTAGLHRVDWNMRKSRAPRDPGRTRRRGPRFRRSPRLPEGSYAVTLVTGKESTTSVFKIEDDRRPLDVSWPRPPAVGEGTRGGGVDDLEEENSRKEIR